MPFTTSHPAIVLPLKKIFPSNLSMSGLIAGSMSPDLLYFIEMNTVNRGLSHSWSGLLTVCLPLGLIFCFAFHLLIKKELIYNLPQKISKHLSGLAESSWSIKTIRDCLVLVVSVLLGALSHFFWDSFTHLTGEMVGFFPVLKNSISISGLSIPIFHLLQHLSTIIGGISVIVYFSFQANLPTRKKQTEFRSLSSKILFWVRSFVISFLFAFIVLNLYRYYFPDRVFSEITIFGLASWAAFFYGTAFTTLVRKLQFRTEKSNKRYSSEYN